MTIGCARTIVRILESIFVGGLFVIRTRVLRIFSSAKSDFVLQSDLKMWQF